MPWSLVFSFCLSIIGSFAAPLHLFQDLGQLNFIRKSEPLIHSSHVWREALGGGVPPPPMGLPCSLWISFALILSLWVIFPLHFVVNSASDCCSCCLGQPFFASLAEPLYFSLKVCQGAGGGSSTAQGYPYTLVGF